MTTPDDKARRDQITKTVMVACCPVILAIAVGTRSWGWPVHQALTGAALLLPVLAYDLTRLWFRYQG
jgi:hypothetical protein